MNNTKLTNEVKQRILHLREVERMGYKQIARILGLQRDTVRNVCRKSGLVGFIGRERQKKKETKEAVEAEQSCDYCGKVISWNGRGRKRKYCSRQCRDKHNHQKKMANKSVPRKCVECGEEFMAISESVTYCSKSCVAKYRIRVNRAKRKTENTTTVCVVCNVEFAPRYKSQKCCSRDCGNKLVAKVLSQRFKTHTCKHCGSVFRHKRSGGTKNLYCSRECAFADKKKNAKQNYCIICNEQIKTGHKYCSDSCRYVERECEICGRKYKTTRENSALTCSNECRKERARRKEKERFVSVKETNPYINLTCKYCGRQFKTNYLANRRKYCSQQCAKKASYNPDAKREENRRRRARLMGARVELFKAEDIYKRDGFVCQLCGKKVDMTKKAPHPMSPTLDHIIPLSKGGTHEPKNVQLAHFRCNSIKSDNIYGFGEQLKLF